MALSSSQSEGDWSVTAFVGGEEDGEVGFHIAPLDTFFMHSAACCVQYSPDGAVLIAGGNHCARIFDSSTGELESTLRMSSAADTASTRPDNHCRAACFSPDFEYVLTSSDGVGEENVKVWNYLDNSVEHTFDEHSGYVCGLDVSCDSRFVASADCEGGLKLWELESGKVLSTLVGEDKDESFMSVAISASMQHVIAGCLDKTIKVWDVETSALVCQYEGHSDSVYCVSFTGEENCVISGSLDGTAKVWDLSDPSRGHCERTLRGHEDFVLCVTASPDERWYMTGSKDRSVRFWDARKDDVAVRVNGHNNSVISVAHDPCGNIVATGSGDHRVRTWSYE